MHALWAVDETPWRTRTPVFRVSRRRLTRDRVCEVCFVIVSVLVTTRINYVLNKRIHSSTPSTHT